MTIITKLSSTRRFAGPRPDSSTDFANLTRLRYANSAQNITNARAAPQAARGEEISMVRLALLNWQQAQRTACFIALTTIVHPVQSQQAKPAEPKVAVANQAVQSQLPSGD